MKRISLIFLFVSTLIIDNCINAQDAYFSQFYATPLYLSPSFAGSANGSRLAMDYRNQWPKLGSVISTSFSFDHNFKEWKSGLGILVVADQKGDGNLGTTTTGFIYSYDIKVNPRLHVRPGMNFQFAQTGIDFTKLYDVTNINSGGTIIGYSNYENMGKDNYFDFSSSVILYTKNYWGGLTLDHLFRPAPSFLKINQTSTHLPIKYSLYGGAKYIYKEDKKNGTEDSFSTTFLLTKQSTSFQFNFGIYWNHTPIVVGMFYRGSPFVKNNLGGHDALIMMTGFKQNNVMINYSYDYTISALSGISGGAHEVSIIYLFNAIRAQKKKRWEVVPCPDFVN